MSSAFHSVFQALDHAVQQKYNVNHVGGFKFSGGHIYKCEKEQVKSIVIRDFV